LKASGALAKLFSSPQPGKIACSHMHSILMRLRAFTPAMHGFLDTIREGHPTAPLLVISPLYCPIHEDTPGPGAFDMSALAAGKVSFRATGFRRSTASRSTPPGWTCAPPHWRTVRQVRVRQRRPFFRRVPNTLRFGKALRSGLRGEFTRRAMHAAATRRNAQDIHLDNRS
jgi:hypothetical protein